jgi:hypothetical protein
MEIILHCHIKSGVTQTSCFLFNYYGRTLNMNPPPPPKTMFGITTKQPKNKKEEKPS